MIFFLSEFQMNYYAGRRRGKRSESNDMLLEQCPKCIWAVRGHIFKGACFCSNWTIGTGSSTFCPVELHIERGGKWWHYRALLPYAALPFLCISIEIVCQWNKLENVYHMRWFQYKLEYQQCWAGPEHSPRTQTCTMVLTAHGAWRWQKAETASLQSFPNSCWWSFGPQRVVHR